MTAGPSNRSRSLISRRRSFPGGPGEGELRNIGENLMGCALSSSCELGSVALQRTLLAALRDVRARDTRGRHGLPAADMVGIRIHEVQYDGN